MNDSTADSYEPKLKLEDCQKTYANETLRLQETHPDGFCNVSFDNILCWPPTPINTKAEVKCFSEFMGIYYDDSQNVTRMCLENGTWNKSTYDNCKELDLLSSNVDTQIYIYLIGFIISTITLIVALFIFTYFKELRCLRNIIHMNLMWSYLLTYTMWIIMLIELNYFKEHMAVMCVYLVTLLHYFHITTFFWMFVEGLYLYILVVRTLTRESFKLRVYLGIGWGTPLLFIIIWVIFKSLFPPLHNESDVCDWFRDSYLDILFQAPTIAVLIINIIFMMSIMVVLVTKLRSANTLEIQQYRKAVKALAVLIPLLGVTYAITIYAPVHTIWDLLRSVLLSLQTSIKVE
ncbi:diuretic hormone receptor-like [Sitophilus oryzae]|uniref:Diuretic hormone receptor-like n=1 Tax=Sitophilus oryzae TaxID=7048 RepID=A0A6J2XFN0_SITOR|nr:diuretic hormone receptor-like [Sitophilus oryzae]